MASIHVGGYCPFGCGSTLYLSDQDPSGIIRCSSGDCPDPIAAWILLSDSEVEHIITFTTTGFIVRHPLRERIDDKLMQCQVHEDHAAMSEAPVFNGRYRVTDAHDEDEPYSYERLLGEGGIV